MQLILKLTNGIVAENKIEWIRFDGTIQFKDNFGVYEYNYNEIKCLTIDDDGIEFHLVKPSGADPTEKKD